MPTSYFMSHPFENWTRTDSELLGTVEVDVDWSVPVDQMRAELRRILENDELWDGRVCVLQVTDAVGGNIRLRALVSANDAAALWDLRCLVRERLVSYVWEHGRDALPRVRAELDGHQDTARPAEPERRPEHVPEHPPSEDSRVFGGSDDGERRGAAFVGRDAPATPDSDSVSDSSQRQG
jgi:hypothetical protein